MNLLDVHIKLIKALVFGLAPLFIISLDCVAQNKVGGQTSYWIVGDQVILDFNSYPPKNDTFQHGSTMPNEISMCDYNGNLLYYSYYRDIKSKNGQTMENGGDFQQRKLTFPYPFNDSIYVIISYGVSYQSNGDWNVKYLENTLNINENNGQGKVITKNILINDSIASHAFPTAFAHARTGKIYMPLLRSTKELILYSFSENGFEGVEKTYDFSTILPGDFLGLAPRLRTFSFTPDGKKFIISDNISSGRFLHIIDFDINTLEFDLTNKVTYRLNDYYQQWGVVSPNSDKMFLQEINGDKAYLKSFDLLATDSLSMLNSTKVIDTLLQSVGKQILLGSGQVNPYGNITMVYGNIENIIDVKKEITFSEIIKPSLVIPQIQKENNKITIFDDFGSEYSQTPFFLPSYFDSTHFQPCEKFNVLNQCNNELTEFFAPPCDSFARYEWDFGDEFSSDSLNTSRDRNPTHTYTQNGRYEVNLTVRTILYTRYFKDTIVISDRITDTTTIGIDTTFCYGDTVTYSIQNGTSLPHKLLWSNGDTTTTTKFNQGGYIWGQAFNSCSEQRDSVYLNMIPRITRPFPEDTVLCGLNSVLLDAKNPGNTFYEWSTGETEKEINVNNSDTLEVEISNQCFTESYSIYVYFEGSENGFIDANIFTPNGDGINDQFKLYESVTDDYYLTIYNRWGRKVFETTNYKEQWTGGQFSNGLYFYNLKFLNCKNQTINYKGSILLSR